MSILGKTIVFHDKADGGYYCNKCKRYLHPDMVPSHKHHTGIQDDLIKFVNDPKTIAKAVEGSMEKRIAMTDTLQTAELRKIVTKLVTDMTVSKTLSEEFLIDELLALINSEVTKKLEAVLAVLPEKINECGDDCQYGKNCKQVITHNSVIDKMTIAITNLVAEERGVRASSRQPERSQESKPRKESR